jgi:hypothetical protein
MALLYRREYPGMMIKDARLTLGELKSCGVQLLVVRGKSWHMVA